MSLTNIFMAFMHICPLFLPSVYVCVCLCANESVYVYVSFYCFSLIATSSAIIVYISIYALVHYVQLYRLCCLLLYCGRSGLCELSY